MHTHDCDDRTTDQIRSDILSKLDIEDSRSGTNFTKAELEKIAEKIGAGEQNRCYFCKEDDKEFLEEHHVIPKRYGGSNEKYNLVTLCRRCHIKLEQLYTNEVFSFIAENINEVSENLERKKQKVIDNQF